MMYNHLVVSVIKFLSQQQEVEKSIIGYGEYQLRPCYSFLAVPETTCKWFRMSEEQRRQHIKKLNSCNVRASHTAEELGQSKEAENNLQCATTPAMNEPIAAGRFNLQRKSTLSVSLEKFTEDIKLPFNTVEGIWNKANQLITEVDAIVPAPGCGKKDKMVKSKSGSTPHLVTVRDKGVNYKCDDKCPQFKSTHLCSHTAAAAEVNGELKLFLEHYCATSGKCGPNLMELAVYGMPSGAGRKGGSVPPKKVKTCMYRDKSCPIGYKNMWQKQCRSFL